VFVLRQIGSDIARALVVLALVFLSFAHLPPAVASPADAAFTVAVTDSFCGDKSDSGLPHAPCHACRLGAGADVPPPSDMPVMLRTVADVHYGALPVLHLPAEPLGTASARGPPALV